MKKNLLNLFFLFTGLIVQAQIADGSAAPDFTATDTDGNTHTLSTYLNSGKNVIMDVSATWCGPCWGFHQAETLKKLHYAYGPDGSDEIVVLFIEGDGSTNMADLLGQTNSSQGDWLSHTPYPVLDNASIASSYQVAYFPTLYGICSSNNNVYEVGVTNNTQTAYSTPSEILAKMDNFCGASNVVGVPNHGMLELQSNQIYVCNNNNVSVPFSVTNYGNNNITTATIVLKENGTIISTENFTGSLNQFDKGFANFDNIAINLNASYTAELTEINGQTPHNTSQNMAVRNYEVLPSEEASTNITINVRTDQYPTEISWELKDSSGTIVASDGPYSGNPNGGGSNANTIKTYNLSLPAAFDCYDVIYKDSYGDGWGSNSDAGIEIVSEGEIIYRENVGNFGSSFERGSAINVSSLETGSFDNNDITIYPNPSSGSIFISQLDQYNMNIYDVTGKQVFAKKALGANEEINLSFLENGIYFVKVQSNEKQNTIKLILK